MKISFVIPCYRSEHTLGKVMTSLNHVMSQRQDYDYEVILINDCSPDNVGEVIKRMAQEDGRITGIELARNYGQHAATMAGYRACTGDIVVTLDDDGESPVHDTFKLVDKILEGEDIVQAKYPVERKSFFRKLGTIMNNAMMSSLIGKPKELVISNFSAMRKFVINEICKYNSPYTYIAGMFFHSTKHIVNVELERPSRLEGESSYSLAKLLKLWINGVLSYSEKPLRISTITGFICAGLGFLLGVITLVRCCIVPGSQSAYNFLMTALLFVGGIIMIELGLIGEYVGRSYVTLNRIPQYVIRDVYHFEKKVQNEHVEENTEKALSC